MKDLKRYVVYNYYFVQVGYVAASNAVNALKEAKKSYMAAAWPLAVQEAK